MCGGEGNSFRRWPQVGWWPLVEVVQNKSLSFDFPASYLAFNSQDELGVVSYLLHFRAFDARGPPVRCAARDARRTRDGNFSLRRAFFVGSTLRRRRHDRVHIG
jgi:hypothetical protein